MFPQDISNDHLADLTRLPNLDLITDVNRLAILGGIAERKSKLNTYAGPRAEAFILYSDRAYDKSEA